MGAVRPAGQLRESPGLAGKRRSRAGAGLGALAGVLAPAAGTAPRPPRAVRAPGLSRPERGASAAAPGGEAALT